MAMEETGDGGWCLSVQLVHGANIRRDFVQSYRISQFGLHFVQDGRRRFIPHQNICLVETEKCREGDSK